jgi:hypothetical protein
MVRFAGLDRVILASVARRAKLQVRTSTQAPRSRIVTCAQAQQTGRREALGFAAAALAAVLAPSSAKADLTADLLARTEVGALSWWPVRLSPFALPASCCSSLPPPSVL